MTTYKEIGAPSLAPPTRPSSEPEGPRRPLIALQPPVAGAALLDEDDTHVVCDALTEVRVRFLKASDRSVLEIAREVFERHVDGLATHRELHTLAATGADRLEARGLPAELAAAYDRDPDDTLALLGFLELVHETYGYDADA